MPSIDVVAHPPTPGLDAALAEITLPPGTVPLWAVGDELFLGCRAPLSGSAVSALEAALGMRVQPVLMLRAAARAIGVAAELEMSAAGVVDLDRGIRLSADERSSHLLEVAGFADLTTDHEEVRADALALTEGLPRVRELARFRDAAARHRPGQVQTPYGARLLLEHDLATIVVESPEDLEPFERAGEVVRAAVASRSGVAAVERTWEALGVVAQDDRVVAFVRELQLRHGVRRLKVLDLFQQLGEAGSMPMDRVVARFGEVSPVEACTAFAAACHTQPADLARIEEQADSEGGPAGLGLRLHDPIDHEVARRLSVAQSDALGAVPYARAHGTLLVAVADPLSASVAAELGRLLGEDFEARPAWRLEIAEAARRAHGQPSVGEFLLEERRINPAQLSRALLIVDRANVSLPNALRSLGVASETEIAQAAARRSGLPFFELGGITLSREIATLLPESLARAEQLLPIGIDGAGEVTVAVADPENARGMDEARRALEGRVRFVVTTRGDVRDALERLYHGLYVEIAATRLRITAPENSADRVLTRPQQIVLGGSALALVILAAMWTVPVVTVAMTFTTAFYLTFAGYKFYLIFRSLSHELAVPVTDEDVAALDDRDLPVYTILVPLYRETAVLPLLVRACRASTTRRRSST